MEEYEEPMAESVIVDSEDEDQMGEL